jgi:hypothetical protein
LAGVSSQETGGTGLKAEKLKAETLKGDRRRSEGGGRGTVFRWRGAAVFRWKMARRSESGERQKGVKLEFEA